MYLALMNASL